METHRTHTLMHSKSRSRRGQGTVAPCAFSGLARLMLRTLQACLQEATWIRCVAERKQAQGGAT